MGGVMWARGCHVVNEGGGCAKFGVAVMRGGARGARVGRRGARRGAGVVGVFVGARGSMVARWEKFGRGGSGGKVRAR